MSELVLFPSPPYVQCYGAQKAFQAVSPTVDYRFPFTDAISYSIGAASRAFHCAVRFAALSHSLLRLLNALFAEMDWLVCRLSATIPRAIWVSYSTIRCTHDLVACSDPSVRQP